MSERRRVDRFRKGLLIIGAFLLSTFWVPASYAVTPEMTLEYLSRYKHKAYRDSRPLTPDHICSALYIGNNRALVVSNVGLALVDLAQLTPAGQSNYIYRLAPINARNAYLYNDNYVYVNTHYGRGESMNGKIGFTIARIDGDVLTKIAEIEEPDILYEKMCIFGEYLYVAAHSHGIRIYSLANPEAPVLVGFLETGFDDAFDIAVYGNTA